MPDTYPHLILQRENPCPEKRSSRGGLRSKPTDPIAHGRMLQHCLSTAVPQAQSDIGGFDERFLFKFEVEKGFDPDELRNVNREIEIVSQEDKQVVVAFLDATALREFEA